VKLLLRQRVHEVPGGITQRMGVHGSRTEKIMTRTRSYNKCYDKEDGF